MTDTAPFADLIDRIDSFLDGRLGAPDPVALAETFLTDGETVLEAWMVSKGQVPTHEAVEGFRLLALHRQGARGDTSFNACRETCRELVYLRNVVALYDDDTAQTRHHLRLQAMVLRHLALFLGGKMTEAGLGEFCCSSRPLRTSVAAEETSSAPVAAS
jgi:hypothetical protein